MEPPKGPPVRSRRPYGLPSHLLYEAFEFHDTLGEGQYGSVWRCTDRRTGAPYACKQMKKMKHPKSVDRETTCFTRVQSHRHVVQLDQLYEDEEDVYFLMEMCNGGDLLPVICQSGGLDERFTSGILWQLVEAVHHCHTRGVIHRDIKPENVLLNKPEHGDIPLVKLADFGLATLLRKGRMAQGWVGSPPYEAPEVVDLQPYDFSADIWSVGVVMYGMLSANWPSFLQGRKFNKLVDFQAPVWASVSPEAKDLIIRMLATKGEDRPTAAQILEDRWFSLFLPEEMLPSRSDMEVELPLTHVHPCSSALLPSLPSPAIPSAMTSPIPPVMTSPSVLFPLDFFASDKPRTAVQSPGNAPLKGNGSFGQWLDGGAPIAWGRSVPGGDGFDFGVGSGWIPEPSHAESKSRPGTATPPPPAESCSESSPSSASSSSTGPDTKGPTPSKAPREGCQEAKELSITRQIGKRLLQIVSVTLAASPMCTRIIPSASTGEAALALVVGHKSVRNMERPSTAVR